MARAEISTVRADLVDVESMFAEKDLLKRVPGARWDAERVTWTVPLSWGACLTLRGVFGARLELGEQLRAWAWRERETRVGPCLALREQLELPGVEPYAVNDARAFPFQQVGIEFLRLAGSALLASEMGLGKTIQAIGALVTSGPDALPALVVAPNSMTRTWARELATWAPEVRVVVAGETAAKRLRAAEAVRDGEADVLVISWDALRVASRLEAYGNTALTRCVACGGPEVAETGTCAWCAEAVATAAVTAGDGKTYLACKPCLAGLGEVDARPLRKAVTSARCEAHAKELQLVGWKTVIADEVHKSKNAKAKQTRALWAVAAGATRRYGLSGTPIANHLGDLWSVMRFVAPEDWPAKTKFVDRFCVAGMNGYGGLEIAGVNPATEREFRAILEPRMLRHPKAAVLPQLPEKTYATRHVDLGHKQRRAYDQMCETMLALVDAAASPDEAERILATLAGEAPPQEVLVATNALARLTRLSQFASTFAAVDAAGGLIMTEPSCKVDALEEMAEELGGQPAVVFAQSRQLIELCERRLVKLGIAHVSIHGRVSPADREAGVELFQRGGVPFCLATLGAGGVGLTLHAAAVAIRLQRSWSLVENLQAEDRIHRIGQAASKVEVIDVVSSGTVEEHQMLVVQGKARRLEEVVHDREALLRMLQGEVTR